MNTDTWVQILDEADYISSCTNDPGRSINPTILSPIMDKK